MIHPPAPRKRRWIKADDWLRTREATMGHTATYAAVEALLRRRPEPQDRRRD